MRWVFPADDGGRAGVLSRELSLHPVAAQVLVSRGHGTPDAASEFLKDGLSDLPDPSTMKGMDRAVTRLCQAVREKEKITLFGDYDVDGITSTTTLATFLRAVGGNVATYIPNRIGEGYGLNLEAVSRIARDGTRLLVTLDCGISAVEEVARAGALGLPVIVVDHHQVGATLPDAEAILNPVQPGCAFPCKHLCAAGIAFHLVVALRRRLRDLGFFSSGAEPNLREYLDLVALGTMADVVPLVGANRLLVKHGLAELTKARRPGVRALKVVAGMAPTAPVSTGQVGFRLGPRLNAAGRLADASLGVMLLCATDESQAMNLARTLDAANAERQGLEKEIVTEALEQAEALGGARARGLVLAKEGWHAGVIGIVASRVVERYHRPTFVVALKDGSGKGSGRSIEGFHLFEALKECAEHLSRFGGHKHAAGLTIAEAALPSFREAFDRTARQCIAEEDLHPRCRIDAVITPSAIDEPLAQGLARLAPFGAGNPEPTLAAMKLSARQKVLPSKSGGPGHLKLEVDGARHLDVIGFGMEERGRAVQGALDAAFHVGMDEWKGVKRVTLKLKDVRKGSGC
jgi:single-stranded-DNA-specific exonuclease